MSSDWGGGRGRGRQDRSRRPDLLSAAQDARGAMQEQFYRVDQFQSDIGGTVELYADLLADRAARTGVVPGWRQLDAQATELIVAYIAALDTFDPLEECPPTKLPEAGRAFAQLTDKLGYLGNDMEGFLERFGSELRRVGEVRQQVESRVAAAVGRVEQAEAAWRQLGEDGLSFDVADQAVARARIAGRKLAAAGPSLTPQTADEAGQVVEKLAAEALTLCTDLPRRAASLRRRIPSLATRIDALRTRADGVPEAMRALRREFSTPNWQDLADREDDVHQALADAGDRLRELRGMHESGDLTGALATLDDLESRLARAEEVIDGPRQRLALLRTMREDPKKPYERARFRLRDVRYLVMDGRQTAQQPWAGRLDAAARDLIGLEGALQGHHPDYWSLHLRLAALEERLGILVADFRAAH